MAAPVDTTMHGLNGRCAEPGCDKGTVFTMAHSAQVWGFCGEHTWPRLHRWLDKLPAGRLITVAKAAAPEPKLPG